MRLSPASVKLSGSPALLALALPLAAALAFSDETLDKVPKSEGYCSRILRVQGTRREGYTEFSLRVEGDPDFYKPGTSYRVTLSAAPPSYFRGFTLIALKENREGDKEEDHAGTFQVRPLLGLSSGPCRLAGRSPTRVQTRATVVACTTAVAMSDP
uniref:Reelin domain-containing protein n=1 Tax=Sus scrofa TaxID=9823 RepID=A0A8D1F3M6_PIG